MVPLPEVGDPDMVLGLSPAKVPIVPLFSLQSVSYTHLDVYKRQVSSRSNERVHVWRTQRDRGKALFECFE